MHLAFPASVISPLFDKLGFPPSGSIFARGMPFSFRNHPRGYKRTPLSALVACFLFLAGRGLPYMWKPHAFKVSFLFFSVAGIIHTCGSLFPFYLSLSCFLLLLSSEFSNPQKALSRLARRPGLAPCRNLLRGGSVHMEASLNSHRPFPLSHWDFQPEDGFSHFARRSHLAIVRRGFPHMRKPLCVLFRRGFHTYESIFAFSMSFLCFAPGFPTQGRFFPARLSHPSSCSHLSFPRLFLPLLRFCLLLLVPLLRPPLPPPPSLSPFPQLSHASFLLLELIPPPPAVNQDAEDLNRQ